MATDANKDILSQVEDVGSDDGDYKKPLPAIMGSVRLTEGTSKTIVYIPTPTSDPQGTLQDLAVSRGEQFLTT
jgi:hypothetical protein